MCHFHLSLLYLNNLYEQSLSTFYRCAAWFFSLCSDITAISQSVMSRRKLKHKFNNIVPLQYYIRIYTMIDRSITFNKVFIFFIMCVFFRFLAVVACVNLMLQTFLCQRGGGRTFPPIGVCLTTFGTSHHPDRSQGVQ